MINEQKLRAEFAVSAELQREFSLGGVESYIAFMKNQDASKIKILERDEGETTAALRSRNHTLKSEHRRLSVDESQLRKKFLDSPVLQSEFSSFESYASYMRHEAKTEQKKADREYRKQIKTAQREVCYA